MRINPPLDDSAVFSKKVRILSDGTAEDWIRWLMAWSEVVRSKPLTTGDAKVGMAQVLLGGKAKETFQAKFLELAQDEFHDVDVSFMSSLEELSKKFLPLKAAAKQKAYLRYHLRMGNQGVKPFIARLRELNSFLPYLPDGQRLEDDEIVEIIDRAKPDDWHIAMLSANIDPSNMDLDMALEYYERLEIMDAIKKKQTTSNTANSAPRGNTKRDRSTNDKTHSKAPNSGKKKWCSECDMDNHNTVDCSHVKRKKRARQLAKEGGNKNRSTDRSSWPKKATEEVNSLKKALAASKKKAKGAKGKKKRDSDASSSDSNESAYNVESNENEVSSHSKHTSDNKKRKLIDFTTEVIGEITDRSGVQRVLRILIDTGSSSTIILK